MVESATVLALLATIVTIDVAQFGLTLDHRERLVKLEQHLDDHES